MGRKVALTLLLALAIWLPRGLALDHFVAVDERSWLTRSGNFYLALAQGDFAATFQRYHPGVTTMWLGMAGFVAAYPDYPAQAGGQISNMSEGIEDFLAAHGHPPMEMLAAGRFFVVLAITLTLLAAFWIAADLLGAWAALAGFALLAFEPQALGLMRMLHVDGLSAAFMLLAALAFLRYAERGRLRDVALSGAAAGLAWLTKSPALFLGPFVLLAAGYYLTQRTQRNSGSTQRVSESAVGSRGLEGSIPTPLRLRRRVWGAAWVLVVWGAVALGVFVALWPAMWVDPVGSVRQILDAAEVSAAEGHSKEIFFNGRTYSGDPGAIFYPLTYVWLTTPVTLGGLLLAAVAYALRLPPLDGQKARRTALWLALYALLFAALMTLGSKKFARYLLPAYLPLDIVAGVGWVALAQWVAGAASSARTRSAAVAVGTVAVAVAVVAQAAFALPHFPYYFTYANPLMGGAAKAPDVLMVGLGEGLDEAARYLNARQEVEGELSVASWYRGGSFNYIFTGRDLDIEEFYQADYAVLYAHQWQRGVPDNRLLNYFATLTPVHVITLRGIEYARVYDLRDAPPPEYFTDWDDAIRLVWTDFPVTPVPPGETFVVRLRLYVIGTMERNLSVRVRLVDAAGQEIAHSQGWPFGAPTSTWQPGEVYVDGHEFTLPDGAVGAYRVEVGFIDPEAQALITPTAAGRETPRPEFLPVGFVTVGPLPAAPSAPLEPPVTLGASAQLLGANLTLPPSIQGGAQAGAPVELDLFWQAIDYAPDDYTTLLHLIGADGQMHGQWDRPPAQGAAPTTLWKPGQVVVDRFAFALPAELPPGDYRLLTGMYDLETLQRLSVARDGAAAGDTIVVGEFTVGP